MLAAQGGENSFIVFFFFLKIAPVQDNTVQKSAVLRSHLSRRRKQQTAQTMIYMQSHGKLTSSHSEVKEGDFSSLFLPVLQLETDSLRFPSPPSSSLGGDTSRSESDLERLRASFRSPGRVLMADAAPDPESLGSLCTVA